MDKYINDPEADLSTALVTLTDNWFCFIIQPEDRWWKKDNWDTLIPIWWVWWKLEKWETLEECLKREALEEIGVNIEILEVWKQFLVIDPNQIVFESNNTENNVTPLFVYRNPRSEKWRKPFTNVFVYLAKLNVKEIKLIDNPAIIELEENILQQIISQEITIEQALHQWWKVKSKINLPQNWILLPLPTVKWIIKFLSVVSEDVKSKIKHILS